MNQKRRKELRRILTILNDVSLLLAAVADEEHEAYDNLPETLQESERALDMEDAANAMDEALDAVSSVIETLEDFAGVS